MVAQLSKRITVSYNETNGLPRYNLPLLPTDIDPADIDYSYTPEITEQWKLIDEERNKTTLFEEMCAYLEKYLNTESKSDLSLRGIFDLSRKVAFRLPNNHHNQDYPGCVICVSAVVPFFDIYFTKLKGNPINTITGGRKTESQIFLSDNIAGIVSSYFDGYTLVPADFSSTTVKGILSPTDYGREATLYQCLLTDHLI